MSNKGHHLFTKLFFLMIGMISLLTILALIIGTIAIRDFIKESILDSTREKLSQKQYLLEHTLENIERTAFSLGQDNNFHKFVLLTGNINEIYPVWKDIVDKMNDTMNSFDMIDSIYLYPFEKDRDILSNKGVISRKDFSDRLFINRLTNKSYNQWQQTRYYSHPILSPITEDPKVLTYVKTVPSQNSMARGLLVFNIEISSLNEILIPVHSDDRIFLINSEGLILVDSQKKGAGNLYPDYKSLLWDDNNLDYIESKGSRGVDLIIRQESKTSDWMYFYIASTPYKVPWILFLKGLLVMTGVFLVLGIIVAYIISYKYTKPWELLVEEFIPANNEDEILALSSTMRELKDENRQYRDKKKIHEDGFLPHGSSHLMVAFEDKMDRWKNGLSLWDREVFQDQTRKMLNGIESSPFSESYKSLLIHEMARILVISFYRKSPCQESAKELLNEDILLIMEKKETWEDKMNYLLETAVVCKDYMDINTCRPQDELIDNLLFYLEDHYREEIYTDSMARKLNLSESYFCRLVKDATGKTFNELLSEIRFKEVCLFLKETDESLESIAELTGLKSKRNLLRNFKKFRDETPGRYRQKIRLEQKAPLIK